MPNRPLPSRAVEYRTWGAERRASLLRDADTWDRMAKWEDEIHLQASKKQPIVTER
jgi:hypothetical protein